MKTSFLTSTVLAVSVLFTIEFCTTAQAISGAGTESDPWQVASVADFDAYCGDPNCWDDYARLDVDLDLAGTTYGMAPIAPDTVNSSTYQGVGFTGSFDGNGHAIINLTIDAATGNDYLGLFGYLGSGAVVRELMVLNIAIAGGTGSERCGGLAGFSYYGTVDACCATGTLTAGGRLGGLVGYNSYGTVRNSYAIVDLTGDDILGGLIGTGFNTDADDCYAAGTVTGDLNCGGLFGTSNSDSIMGCFWDSEIGGPDNGAGQGKTTELMQTESTFTDAGWDFIDETDNGTDRIWIIDEDQDYPRHTLIGTGSQATPFLIRSRADFERFRMNALYWAQGLTTRLAADIDLGDTIYTSEAPIAPDTSYYAGFQGTDFDGTFDGDGHVVRNLQIDVEPYSGGFLGLFGGTGLHGVIRNLGVVDCDLSGGDPGGLVGRNMGLIEHCSVTGSVTGGDFSGYTGGLAAMSQVGRIQYCHTNVTVSVDGGDYGIGGLVGNNSAGSDIFRCYALGDVSGAGASEDVGGLVGTNYGYCTIINSYATGAVSGGDMVGGLCGSNVDHSQIDTCYAAGAVTDGTQIGGLVGFNDDASAAMVNDDNCFWDIDTSGQANSDGGTGRTTEQMKTAGTFLDAGWDLITLWSIEEDQTYPLLRKYSACDTNYDGRVDLIDFAVFAQQWLQ